ncbi:MAG: hypothetical protein K0M45_07990 [Candidatus Paracaedibacteraceae bacterium]|nr:hypothetical protein [Candidatus Paracaedibacteraceae bacterium]
MRKYILLSFLTLLVISSPSLRAMEKASSSEAFLQRAEPSPFLSKGEEREEKKHESTPVVINNGESKHNVKEKQLTPSSLIRKIRPTVEDQTINYLDQKVPIPDNFELIMLGENYYHKQLKTSREAMCHTLKKVGISVIDPLDRLEGNLSIIFYSHKYDICFFMTDDIRHFVFFSEELLAQSTKKTKESIIVNNFITDLMETLNTSSMELLTTRQYIDFFDTAKIKNLGFSSPLKYLVHIYNKNLAFFDTISNAIGKCEKDRAARLENLLKKEKVSIESFREQLEEQLKEQLKEEKESKESFREQLEEAVQKEWLKKQRYVTLLNEKLFIKQCGLIYQTLIEKKIFEDVLREDYQKDVEINSGLYNLTLGWGDLSNSLRLTCSLGAGPHRQEGEAFYENFIFPFLDSLFSDLQKNYLNFNTFFKDKFEVTPDEIKRLIVVKIAPDNVNKSPVIALRGGKPTSKNLPAIESTPQNVVAQKQNCALM